MKKRILIIVLLYVMMLCLSSCGKTKDSFNTDTYTTDKQVEDTISTEISDMVDKSTTEKQNEDSANIFI